MPRVHRAALGLLGLLVRLERPVRVAQRARPDVPVLMVPLERQVRQVQAALQVLLAIAVRRAHRVQAGLQELPVRLV